MILWLSWVGFLLWTHQLTRDTGSALLGSVVGLAGGLMVSLTCLGISAGCQLWLVFLPVVAPFSIRPAWAGSHDGLDILRAATDQSPDTTLFKSLLGQVYCFLTGQSKSHDWGREDIGSLLIGGKEFLVIFPSIKELQGRN